MPMFDLDLDLAHSAPARSRSPPPTLPFPSPFSLSFPFPLWPSRSLPTPSHAWCAGFELNTVRTTQNPSLPYPSSSPLTRAEQRRPRQRQRRKRDRVRAGGTRGLVAPVPDPDRRPRTGEAAAAARALPRPTAVIPAGAAEAPRRKMRAPSTTSRWGRPGLRRQRQRRR